MSSTVVMAPVFQHSTRPQSAYELGSSTGSLFELPHHRRSGSGEVASSMRNKATSDFKTTPSNSEDFDLPSFNTDFELDTSIFANGKVTDSLLEPIPLPPIEIPELTPTLNTKPTKQLLTARSKKSSMIDRPRSWLISGSKSAKDSAGASDDKHIGPVNSKKRLPQQSTSLQPPERSLSGPESFANFARRSWISRSSRSPSTKATLDPVVGQAQTGTDDLARAPTVKPCKPPHRLRIITTNNEAEDTKSSQPNSKPFALATSYLSKKQKTFFARDGTDSDHSCASSATSLNRASNSIRTSASQSICSDGNTNTPTTDESCNEMTPKLRDPLWSNFKTLDLEVKDFVSTKQTAQRVAQVQSVLLPFLKSTRDHPSIKIISLEDVERRTLVLNKWWNSLLDMLQGPLPQPIPGMDRPILLEAATMLMMRPEWRQSTSYMQPLAERSPLERVRSRSWTSASKSTTDSFAHFEMLAESAEHNVRTMFVANLVKQVGYVVEKMSLRHAPLSLVNFSGKTCAYAFFFAPSVADVLVRLWGLTPDLIRRAGNELGLPRKDTGESDDIGAFFPPRLGGFGWSSPRAVWDSLKQIPKMPLLVARISWTGPWVARWKGRDTDLFFIFCKYFHVLSDQFVPPGLPLTEKARSPAFALVHAQFLSIMDSTIHRQSGLDQPFGAPLIDSATGPDASALALPLPPTNLMKGMNENRLVILLRDFLSDDAPELSNAKHTFAETFAALMKAAVRKISLYNNSACFTLCDFLEEVLMIYHDFETPSKCYVDWPFWIEVCKKMCSSMNTMTEVRMLSFVFTVWESIAKDSRRKVNVCLEWLLTEESFNTFFNNWCPMVRAYYQRLVCWRMCRYTGGSNEMDMNIYLTVAARLKANWAHYLFLKQDAEGKGRTLPSTAPMSPAMGKKFMIIRQEANTPQRGLFMGFDTFARTAANPVPLGNQASDTSGLARTDPKKRWSLLGKVLAITSSNGGQSPSDELPKSHSDPSRLRRDLADPAPLVTTSRQKTATSEDDSLGSSPVYDEQKYIFKFVLGWQQNSNQARDRALTRPRLPIPTQARISTKSHAARAPLPPSSPTPGSSVQSPPETPRPLLPQTGDDLHSLTASVEEWLRNTPTNSSGFDGNDDRRGGSSDDKETQTQTQLPGMDNAEGTKEQFTRPIKPSGVFAKNAVYCGRALAEWSQVVSECNIFTERRQDDGIDRLCDVEVPFLGVEGFRKLGA